MGSANLNDRTLLVEEGQVNDYGSTNKKQPVCCHICYLGRGGRIACVIASVLGCVLLLVTVMTLLIVVLGTAPVNCDVSPQSYSPPPQPPVQFHPYHSSSTTTTTPTTTTTTPTPPDTKKVDDDYDDDVNIGGQSVTVNNGGVFINGRKLSKEEEKAMGINTDNGGFVWKNGVFSQYGIYLNVSAKNYVFRMSRNVISLCVVHKMWHFSSHHLYIPVRRWRWTSYLTGICVII
nr:hypothetical protein GCMLICPM_00156 [White spot syndrome virus]WRY71052.1 hypothetical protein OACAMADH_00153 [White spot syndrome virus]BDX28442.1 MAG: hypothetical protein [White spot syndrome virus]